MGRKFLLEIIWISAQNNGFHNIKTVNKEVVHFSNGWMLSKIGSIFTLRNFNDKHINIDIDVENAITTDMIKKIKEFLSTEFCLDGEKK